MPTRAFGGCTGKRPVDSARTHIRSATSADFDAILRLNREWEHFTSPLDRVCLERLHAQALYHCVCERDARVVAFLLALGPGTDYDSPNYRYFDDGHDDFVYIDRVVVCSSSQRTGLGDALSDDLLGFVRGRGITRIVCEVDIEPPNAASDRFHARKGFSEVGTQWVADGRKRVSLRECLVV